MIFPYDQKLKHKFAAFVAGIVWIIGTRHLMVGRDPTCSDGNSTKLLASDITSYFDLDQGDAIE